MSELVTKKALIKCDFSAGLVFAELQIGISAWGIVPFSEVLRQHSILIQDTLSLGTLTTGIRRIGINVFADKNRNLFLFEQVYLQTSMSRAATREDIQVIKRLQQRSIQRAQELGYEMTSG